MKSEVAGDKVTPLDSYDLDLLRRVVERSASVSEWDVHDTQRIQNIQESLRSQVESGLTGRYNPETHVVVPIDRLALMANRCAMRSDPSTAGVLREWLEENGLDARKEIERVLSPSPETSEPSKNGWRTIDTAPKGVRVMPKTDNLINVMLHQSELWWTEYGDRAFYTPTYWRPL